MLRSVFSRAASLRAPQTRVLQKDLRPFSSSSSSSPASEDARVTLLVHEFRKHAHLHARVNPIRHGAATGGVDVRAPFTGDLRGLRESDSVAGHGDARTVGQLVAQLQAAYCGSLTVEAEQCERDEAAWLAAQLESTAPPTLEAVASERLARYGEVMLLSQAFDEYLHRKLRMVKRYGLEGGESLMVAMEALFQQCVASGIDDVVVGMPHRGRNNLLTVLLDYPPSSMFAKMRGQSLLPPGAHGLDDVLSHIAQSADVGARYGGALHVSLLHNPSHLEAVDPVALGKARARQEERLPEPPGVVAAHDRGAWPRLRASARRTGTLCVQMHGDGAVAGQGVVAESALLARLPGYTTLGTIHIVVNNQVAFTCEGEDARSSRFATDIAKVNGSPVLRVNGEDPVAVARAAELAVRFRAQFGGDVWIDLICYRRHGHNELDEPAFTQPSLYAEIASHVPIAQQFAKALVARGVWQDGAAAELVKRFEAQLDREFELVGTPQFTPATSHLTGAWRHLRQGLARDMAAPVDTGVAEATLRRVADASVALPASVSVHRRLQKGFIDARRAKVKEGGAVDYATAEALAFGTLMLDGHSVRLSGQDVQRGTFSHRHVVLTDQKTAARHCPLNDNLGAGAGGVGTLQAVQSPLSEFAVMGFEYGYSWQRPDALTLWEAQFGDFANTAQVIIDHFVASGEHKWLRQSGLVLLLPHGYDGAGPEHSSSRIERFLQLSNDPVARDAALAAAHMPNWSVVNPTTPANYFHALRRQLKWPFRKPLVVVAPKTLIRLPECVSPLADMAAGTHFQPVIDDASVADADAIADVVLLSGKLYYDLVDERQLRQGGAGRTALVRLEQLTPFPHDELARVLARYRNAKRIRWCQEEPQNQGAWTFVQPRVGRAVEYVGSDPLPASALGIYAEHAKLAPALFEKCLGPVPPGAVKAKKAVVGGE
jgi:probable 2-oxoglutarate dehydrogenase E1 component DHKTD1